ncbi:MAG: hypothetical protein Q4F69_02455 [Bacteroidia bacterium]|nr:hypothetical protein [Bacteroidia bacterium]
MRDENFEMIVNNMFLPAGQRKALTDSQERLLLQVTDCYNLQLQKPMISRVSLRDYLINEYKVSKVQAYKIIQYSALALGNVASSHKNWVRQRIEFLCEQAYIAAMAKDFKKSDALTKIANTLSKAFATNIDEGEIIDAQRYLEIGQVNIVVDPAAIGINVSPAAQKEIDKMLHKYQIEDVCYEDVDDNGNATQTDAQD